MKYIVLQQFPYRICYTPTAEKSVVKCENQVDKTSAANTGSTRDIEILTQQHIEVPAATGRELGIASRPSEISSIRRTNARIPANSRNGVEIGH